MIRKFSLILLRDFEFEFYKYIYIYKRKFENGIICEEEKAEGSNFVVGSLEREIFGGKGGGRAMDGSFHKSAM